MSPCVQSENLSSIRSFFYKIRLTYTMDHQDFATALQAFLRYLQFQKRYSQHTIIAYQNDLGQFNDFIVVAYGDLPISDITSGVVRSWLASLKEADMESKSINRKISSLKSFFKYHLKQSALTSSPMTTIVSPKVKKRLPQYVEEKDMQTLLQHVPFDDNWQGQTEKLVIELFYQAGIRRAELTGLKESQLNSGNNCIKVLGKGNKERVIPIHSDLVGRLKNYIAAKRQQFDDFDTGVLLVSSKGKALYAAQVYAMVKKHLSEVTTISKKSPHVLRHSFATHLMNHGADLNAVKELLGHSSLAATQVYTHNSIKKLKEVHKKAHPKA
jgi:integrase/recombinase XerC